VEERHDVLRAVLCILSKHVIVGGGADYYLCKQSFEHDHFGWIWERLLNSIDVEDVKLGIASEA
jgi:hypothetical protein